MRRREGRRSWPHRCDSSGKVGWISSFAIFDGNRLYWRMGKDDNLGAADQRFSRASGVARTLFKGSSPFLEQGHDAQWNGRGFGSVWLDGGRDVVAGG